MALTLTVQGWVGRLIAKTRTLADGAASDPAGPRMSHLSEQYVLSPISGKQLLAEEGSYFVTSLAPGAAALAYGIISAFSATAGFIAVQNADQPGGKKMSLDYLRFVPSVAPASATSAIFASKTDTGPRVPTANLSQATPQNANAGSKTGSVGNVWFPSGGTLTLPGEVAPRVLVGNMPLRAQIPIALDEYVIAFGATDLPAGALVTAAPAGASRIVVPHPPLTLEPQSFALFYLWFPANATTAASFAMIDMGHFER